MGYIARLKLDAQGADLDIIRSAGSQLQKLLFVQLETQDSRAAVLYEGQVFCEEIVQEMQVLGFAFADQRLATLHGHTACADARSERDLHFVRLEVARLWHSW